MPSDLLQTGNKLTARTADAWEMAMQPVADVHVQEVLGRQFSADMQLFGLPRTVLFSLKLPSTRVACPGASFISVNILSSGGMYTASPTRHEWESGTMHVVNHAKQRYEFSTDDCFDAMTLCFRKRLLTEYALKFHNGDDSRLEHLTTDLVVDPIAGECFIRFAKFVWEELNRGGVFLRSPLATQEIEDSLWALLLTTIEGGPCGNSSQRTGGYATYVKPAEEFILGQLDKPLRVADIAGAVGVSVPTLNRAFRKCHGMGPKAFVKMRRLDRARSELQRADPQENSVSEIATKYAFWHLSQFAADYKRAFHEAPSETLRRGQG